MEGSVVLFRDKPSKLSEYFVVYSNRMAKGGETLYQIDFYNDASINNKLFSLFPTIKQNEKMGAVFNPSTRNFIEKDVYTYISHAELLGPDIVSDGQNGTAAKPDSPSGTLNPLNYNLVSKQN